jgi:hypothetical protein
MGTNGARFRHRVEYHPGSAEVAWLDALGDEGWEVVMAEPEYEERGLMAPVRVGYHWLFKRLHLQHPAIVSEANVTVYKEETDFDRAFPVTSETQIAMAKKKRTISPEHHAKMQAGKQARRKKVQTSIDVTAIGDEVPSQWLRDKSGQMVPRKQEGHDADAAE